MPAVVRRIENERTKMSIESEETLRLAIKYIKRSERALFEAIELVRKAENVDESHELNLLEDARINAFVVKHRIKKRLKK